MRLCTVALLTLAIVMTGCDSLEANEELQENEPFEIGQLAGQWVGERVSEIYPRGTGENPPPDSLLGYFHSELTITVEGEEVHIQKYSVNKLLPDLVPSYSLQLSMSGTYDPVNGFINLIKEVAPEHPFKWCWIRVPIWEKSGVLPLDCDDFPAAYFYPKDPDQGE